jgi:hypothetical protein
MIYLKSICGGLACVLGTLYVVFFITGIVLRFVASAQGKGTVGFFISFHSPIVWLPSLVIFTCGSFWAYRRLSR